MSSLPNHPERGAPPGGVQAKVEIYSARHCGYCLRAKRLLEDKGVAYVEYEIDGDDGAWQRMMERTGGRRTLPQIFIGDRGVGGFIELYQLENSGQLDILLKGGEETKGETLG